MCAAGGGLRISQWASPMRVTSPSSASLSVVQSTMRGSSKSCCCKQSGRALCSMAWTRLSPRAPRLATATGETPSVACGRQWVACRRGAEARVCCASTAAGRRCCHCG